ncbi:hypothetical protein ABT404_02745 [Streptomyces hyaluromycini]|uniref:Uncharacterized protein n=1 Tax=Streptomyces hyaluromycini TaxID=1377993 RepID=A0ABV1WNH3_9ACTN
MNLRLGAMGHGPVDLDAVRVARSELDQTGPAFTRADFRARAEHIAAHLADRDPGHLPGGAPHTPDGHVAAGGDVDVPDVRVSGSGSGSAAEHPFSAADLTGDLRARLNRPELLDAVVDGVELRGLTELERAERVFQHPDVDPELAAALGRPDLGRDLAKEFPRAKGQVGVDLRLKLGALMGRPEFADQGVAAKIRAKDLAEALGSGLTKKLGDPQKLKEDLAKALQKVETPAKSRVLAQPGYATGDQFGIAAALMGDKNLHVVVVTGMADRVATDKGPAIEKFYRDSGIESHRIHLARVEHGESVDSAAKRLAGEFMPGDNPDVVPVGTGTTWVADNFSVGVRRLVREHWKLDDAGFSAAEKSHLGQWLGDRGIAPASERDTIVLWSRFSGKKGDVHVEHDTSYTGIEQILGALKLDKEASGGTGPLVVIAGDAFADPGKAGRYPAMAEKFTGEGLEVHDLTHFWETDDAGKQALKSWGGDSRIGQMKLYEYLRQNSGELRHLGFRSGNLEALALSGHTVRYLEEPLSHGGDRMVKWHAARNSPLSAPGTGKFGKGLSLAPGYERILVKEPPTRSGKFIASRMAEIKALKKAGTLPAGEAKVMENALLHPDWAFGAHKDVMRPAETAKFAKGFAADDLDTITGYLTGGHPAVARPQPATTVPPHAPPSHAPLPGTSTEAGAVRVAIPGGTESVPGSHPLSPEADLRHEVNLRLGAMGRDPVDLDAVRVARSELDQTGPAFTRADFRARAEHIAAHLADRDPGHLPGGAPGTTPHDLAVPSPGSLPGEPHAVASGTAVAGPSGLSGSAGIGREFIGSPGDFLRDRQVLLRMDEGLRTRTPDLGIDYGRFLHWMDRQDRHWFTLTPRADADSVQKVYLLTPAIEKYTHEFAGDGQLAAIVDGRELPALGGEGDYIAAHYVPYFQGESADAEAQVGHRVIPVERGGDFNPDLVFTGAMNGCAFAVTPERGGEAFTAWHYQSPTTNWSHSAKFRMERRPTDWYGDAEYQSLGTSSYPETTNVLVRTDDGWHILSQENHSDLLNPKLSALNRYRSRPLELKPGREWVYRAGIHRRMAEEWSEKLQSLETRRVVRLGNNPADLMLRSAFDLLKQQAERDIRLLGGVTGNDSFADVALRQAGDHSDTAQLVGEFLKKHDAEVKVEEARNRSAWTWGKTSDGHSVLREQIIFDIKDNLGVRWGDRLREEADVPSGRPGGDLWQTEPGAGSHALSPEADLRHEVNLRLGRMGHDPVGPEAVGAAHGELEDLRGAAFTRADFRARADEIAVRIAGLEPGGLPGGLPGGAPGAVAGEPGVLSSPGFESPGVPSSPGFESHEEPVAGSSAHAYGSAPEAMPGVVPDVTPASAPEAVAVPHADGAVSVSDLVTGLAELGLDVPTSRTVGSELPHNSVPDGVSTPTGAVGLPHEAAHAGTETGPFPSPQSVDGVPSRPSVLDEILGRRTEDTGPDSGTTGSVGATLPAPDQGLRLTGANGLPADGDRVVRTGPDGVRTVTGLDGTPLPGAVTDLGGGRGFRITDDATGVSVRHDTLGRLQGTDIALADERGVRGGLFVAEDGVGGRVLTDTAGGPVAGRTLAELPDGAGFRVTDDTTGVSARYGADGGHRERGIALADPATGQRGQRFAVPDGAAHRLTDAAGTPLNERITALPEGAGFRADTPTGYATFGPDGAVTGDGLRLTGHDGTTGYVDRPLGGGPRWLTDDLAPDPTRTAVLRQEGHIDLVSPGGAFRRFDGTGAHVADGTPLPNEPGGRILVTGHPGAGAMRGTPWLEDRAGNALTDWKATPREQDGVRFTYDRQGVPRHGEFLELGADGTLVRQGFNVLDSGRPTPFRYEVDHVAGTWHRTDVRGERRAPGLFHSGKADRAGAANGGLRLLSSTKAAVPVFERRLLAGGDVLDAFRRTDTIQFGRTNPRTTWTRWSQEGEVRGSGTRHYDTAGTGWVDKDTQGAVREFREGLQKYDGKAGHVLAERAGDGSWTWHRYDGAGRELGSGPRVRDRYDSGWTDRAGDGRIVQRQWGMGRLPEHQWHYQEFTLQSDGTLRDTWQGQSPQGKETGGREVFDDGRLTTERWSEQRPPLWARDLVPGAGRPQGLYAHVASDNGYQLFTWTKEAAGAESSAAHVESGVRYVGMDGGTLDLRADGSFARSTTKLFDGTTLKAGDHAGRPPYEGDGVPWRNGDRSGYRDAVRNRPGVLWADSFRDAEGTWVVREGLPGGQVREYATPQALDGPVGRGAWVTRDAHGNLTGLRHPDPAHAGHHIEGTGPADSDRWTWRRLDADGNEHASGRREFARGSNDTRLPWDDSYRDYDAAGGLVRERRMLDSGRYVDAWRDPAGDRWPAAEFNRQGTRVAPGQEQFRTWWDGRAWQDRWTPGARRFRDRLSLPGPDGTPTTVVVRETPPYSGGPLRVREYAGGEGVTPYSVWKEYDHGTVVRQRVADNGGFLETDVWRGQWNRYARNGDLVAQRTDSGLVFESDMLGRMRLTGNEYDFRGPVTELRGWGRRIREAQRMPWSGTVLPVSPDGAGAGAGEAALREARYEPYWQSVTRKAALEFGQEFLLEFGANLAVNGIIEAVQGDPFSGKDVLKSFANAAVGSAVKTGVSHLVHENRMAGFRGLGQYRAGLSNLDSGKHWNRRPGNHDKFWGNEWGGNENPTRWRQGTYDFAFGAGSSVLSGFVNGSMNAAVWGVTDADGNKVRLHGWAALGDGGINGLASLTTSSATGLAKTVFMNSAAGRLFHRQGFTDFWLQLPFKIFEKTIQSVYLTSIFRARINPDWYRSQQPHPGASSEDRGRR